LTSGHSDAQGWASECPDVKNYKWLLNPVWYRMLYSCRHMTTVGVKGLTIWNLLCAHAASSIDLSGTATQLVNVSKHI